MAEFVYRDGEWLPSLVTKQSLSPGAAAEVGPGGLSVCLLMNAKPASALKERAHCLCISRGGSSRETLALQALQVWGLQSLWCVGLQRRKWVFQHRFLRSGL